MDIIKYLKIRNYVLMASTIKGQICAWRNSLLLENGEGKPWSQIETYQTDICMPDKQREKKPWKNINTDGKEIADLQETMQSDSSAGSGSTPDLAGGPKGACSAAKSASPEADVALWAVCRKSRYPACNSASGSSKIRKNSNSAWLCSIASKPDFYFQNHESEKKNALYQ